MAAQQHKIMRQVLEVRGCPPDAAQRIQSELRGVCYPQLLPLIEKVCSDLSTPDRIARIDRIEIDLGEVPLNALESAITDRFEAAFSRGLAAAIEAAPEIDSGLELFAYFIRTGTVPWWADRSDHGLLEASLKGLIGRAPQALRRALHTVADHERILRRIARAYPDRLLDDLAGVLLPPWSAAYPSWGTAWLAMLAAVSGARGYPARTARDFWWEEVLRAASAGGTPVSEALHFFQAILTRVARRLGYDYPLLIADLRRTLADGAATGTVQPWVRDIAESLSRELDGDSMTTRIAAAPDVALVIPEPASRHAAPIQPSSPPRTSPAIRSEPDARMPTAAHDPAAGVDEQDAVIDLRFSDADEIYVENAGLVILWPFLENFFNLLGLTEDKRFRDKAAVHRAVGLLQHIASEDQSPPEYLLPLNKVLCGMAPDEVFDFGPDITAAEIEACTDLLTAVIEQAPILHEMSVAGFRGSFLLRKGQLSSRDGNWLLRVERVTYDIVLDRFPWSVNLVKLPWMEAMMQVEW